MTAHPRLHALCCGCGTQRTTTTSGSTHRGDDYHPAVRCTVRRRCHTCGTQTVHAYLREDDGRDVAEQREYERTAMSRAQRDACLAIERDLRALGVRVYFNPDPDLEPEAQLNRYLDDGVYTITVRGAFGPERRGTRLLLQHVWDRLWTVEHDGAWFAFPADETRPPMVARRWGFTTADRPEEYWAPYEGPS